MAKKENARAAWKEIEKMVGLDKPEEAADTMTAEPAAEPAVEAPVKFELPKKTEKTVIADGVTIKGDITSNGDVIVGGIVCGNIECDGILQCHGTIEGNISALSIELNEANIKGDLHAKEDLHVDADTVIVGNATAENVSLDGKLRGDLTVTGMTQLNPHAVLMGNISTNRLSIHEGSCFTGSLKMNSEKDLAALFPADK